MLRGFRDFLFRGNVVDLAVAVVIGTAFNDVVNAFIASLIDPLIAIALGTAGATNLAEATVGAFPVGLFLSALISFLVKAFVIYFFVVRPFSGLAAKLAASSPPPADVAVLTEIRDELRRQSGLAAGRGATAD